MNKETEKLDAEIQRRFIKSGKDEFTIGDKFKLIVNTFSGQCDPEISVMNLQVPAESSLPLRYLKPEDLKIIEDHFKHTGPDTNPFMADLADDDDPLKKNPFID